MRENNSTGRPTVKVVPQSRPRRQRAKRLQRAAAVPPIRLTDRDLAVLEALGRHRLFSGDQLGRLVFECGASRARRRLRALYDHGLIERVSVAARPTRGIPPFVYVLSARGAEALAAAGIPSTGGGVSIPPGTLRHRLLINECFASLTAALRNRREQLRNWRHEQELKLPSQDGRGIVERITHPSLSKPSPFLPDAYFELARADGSSFAFFVEIDLATHPQRVWRHRAKLYTAYADPATGLFRQRYGRETFRLLIVTTPDYRGRSRKQNVLESIAATIGSSDLFLATTLDDLQAERILGPVWHQPGGTRPCSIFDNPGARPVARRR